MSQAVGAQPSGWVLLVMGIVVLLLAGLSCAAYLLLFRGGGRAVQRGATQRRLADQLARGQITEQEYRHLSSALDATRAGKRRNLHTRRDRVLTIATRELVDALHRRKMERLMWSNEDAPTRTTSSRASGRPGSWSRGSRCPVPVQSWPESTARLPPQTSRDAAAASEPRGTAA